MIKVEEQSQIDPSIIEEHGSRITDTEKKIKDLSDLLSGAKSTSQELEKRLEKNNDLVFFGFIVIIVMVAGMLLDNWRETQATYLHLLEKVNALEISDKTQTYELRIGGTD